MLKYVCLKFASHSGQQQQQQEDSDVSILEIKPSGIGKEEGKEEGQSFGRYLRQSWGWAYPSSTAAFIPAPL